VNIINCGNSHAPMRLRSCDSSLDGCAKPLFPNAPWTLGTRVMEFCVKELSKENHVTDNTMPPSERRCKQPAAWAPISALIWHDKELCPAQIRIMMGFKDIRTAYRNLQDMEEAGLLKHRYKDGNKQTKWYFNV
jgi:hypothetical protein